MRAFLLTTGVIFSFVAVAWCLRLVLSVPVQVGGVSVPVWASLGPLAVTTVMATWAFRLARGVGAR
ncbi:MAG: hypothetical protein ACHQQ3_00420 [Gemmatimonadales bacterium]